MKALVLSLCLLGSVSLVAQDWSLQTPHLRKSVFKLESTEGRCSAVLVNDGIVLTAAHCIPEKVEGRSVAVDEKHAEVVKYNTVLDLALLKVNGLSGTSVALRKEETNPGLPVAVVGFGHAALKLKFGFGWVSDARDDSLRGVGDRLYFSAAGTVPGDSGGALVDLSGRLVGIVQGGLPGGTILCFASPAGVVEDFVKPHWPAVK